MITLRAAHASDAADIANLLRTALEAPVLAVSAFGCSGFHHLVMEELSNQPNPWQRAYWCVAVDLSADKLTGCCQMLVRENYAVINAIAVASYYRGQGVARRLLAYAADAVAAHSVGRVYLDVSSSNPIAYAWYHRLGFADVSQLCWYQINASPGGIPDFSLQGYEAALSRNRKSGFGAFSVNTTDHNHGVCMLGESLFRVRNGPRALIDRLDHVLYSLDKRRQILFADVFPPSISTHHLQSRFRFSRLGTELDHLRESLARHN